MSDIKSTDSAAALVVGHHLSARSKWYSDLPVHRSRFPSQWHPWLFATGSLTSQLTEFSQGDFQVRVLRQKWLRPHYREAKKLAIATDRFAHIREVQLLCNGCVVVYARSVIPAPLYLSDKNTLANMGSRPLGHLLFNDGRMRPSKREIAVCQLHKHSVYGRVTPYQYRSGEILVSEYFVNNNLVA